jgi:hypothetical protein
LQTHSFPTRRSSDLSRVSSIGREPAGLQEITRALVVLSALRGSPQASGRVPVRRYREHPAIGREDRLLARRCDGGIPTRTSRWLRVRVSSRVREVGQGPTKCTPPPDRRSSPRLPDRVASAPAGHRQRSRRLGSTPAARSCPIRPVGMICRERGVDARVPHSPYRASRWDGIGALIVDRRPATDRQLDCPEARSQRPSAHTAGPADLPLGELTSRALDAAEYDDLGRSAEAA